MEPRGFSEAREGALGVRPLYAQRVLHQFGPDDASRPIVLESHSARCDRRERESRSAPLSRLNERLPPAVVASSTIAVLATKPSATWPAPTEAVDARLARWFQSSRYCRNLDQKLKSA